MPARSSNVAQPAAFSRILGAELQPGLYKLRLWAACTPSLAVRNQRISVSLMEKAPSDLNRALLPEMIWRTNRMIVVLGVRQDDMTLPSMTWLDLPGGAKVFGAR